MLYKRQLICYIKDNFDNLGQHWTMQRHTLLAENIDISLRRNCVYGLSCHLQKIKSCPKLSKLSLKK